MPLELHDCNYPHLRVLLRVSGPVRPRLPRTPLYDPESAPRPSTFCSTQAKLIELTDEVLFADVWERPELSKRDRSLITVAALVALGRREQLPGHLRRARDNGLTEEELIEVVTHLAFYAGWPTSMTAVPIAKDVFADTATGPS